MVSDKIYDRYYKSRLFVLILVLMEYGLWQKAVSKSLEFVLS